MDANDDNLFDYNRFLELKSISEFFDFFKSDNSEDALKIFHSNIRSFSKNADELFVYLNELPELDFIVLSECWLQEGEEGRTIDGFDIVLTDKRRNRADGVIVYFNNRLTVTTSQISLGDVYGINLTFKLHNKIFCLLAFYRTFDSDAQLFINSLENYLDTLSKDTMIILTGDINLDLFDLNLNNDSYLNCLLGAGLVQCIDKPTRVTSNSSTCIDHFFVRYTQMSNVQSAVLQTNITDHFSTGLTITFPATTSSVPLITVTATRCIIDLAQFSCNLAQTDWNDIYVNENVNSCVNAFQTIVTETMHKSKKALKNSSRCKRLKPWITNALVKLIRERDKLSKK